MRTSEGFDLCLDLRPLLLDTRERKVLFNAVRRQIVHHRSSMRSLTAKFGDDAEIEAIRADLDILIQLFVRLGGTVDQLRNAASRRPND